MAHRCHSQGGAQCLLSEEERTCAPSTGGPPLMRVPMAWADDEGEVENAHGRVNESRPHDSAGG
jgi:hypothetical protein